VLLIRAVRIIYRTWAEMKRAEHNQ
jgi:hypothetical protein